MICGLIKIFMLKQIYFLKEGEDMNDRKTIDIEIYNSFENEKINDKSPNYIITNDNAVNKNLFAYVRIPVIVSYDKEGEYTKELKELELYKIFVEKISTKESERPMLNEALEHLKSGDILYISDFSKLARSTKNLLDILMELIKRDINVISLKEKLNTQTPEGSIFLKFLIDIYEFERSNTLERQREGIALARANGKFKGRKEISRPQDWENIYNMYKTRAITGTEAMRRLGLKRNTFYKFVKQERG